jgi:hypothetical protein
LAICCKWGAFLNIRVYPRRWKASALQNGSCAFLSETACCFFSGLTFVKEISTTHLLIDHAYSPL